MKLVILKIMEVRGRARTASARAGWTNPASATQVSGSRTIHHADEAFVHVRDLILNPASEKRVFQSEAEFAGYFGLGSVQDIVLNRLLSQGFAKRVNKRLELCRFEPGTRVRALGSRVYLDTLSLRLALPRLGEDELDRIQTAVVAFCRGPRLVEACVQISVIMSVLHDAARRPLLSIVTQDLHRQLIPYTYLHRDQIAFDNLATVLSKLTKLLREGRLETLCSELASTYQENARLLSSALAEFSRFHRVPPPDARVGPGARFEAPALHVLPQIRQDIAPAA
ncbi:MAG TPA: hypothetical protein VE641_06585 [Chthoniobacterales bacterium]|nr:hypothetical protein [Chthoniobacterales bacterium]